jgi:hypothetical protein
MKGVTVMTDDSNIAIQSTNADIPAPLGYKPISRVFNQYNSTENNPANPGVLDSSPVTDRLSAELNLDRNTHYHHGYFVANYDRPRDGYFHTGLVSPSGSSRRGVIQTNWAGVRTSDTWQDFHATELHGRGTHGTQGYRDFSTVNSLSTRLWLIDRYARTPIPVNQYYVDPSQLSPGNFRSGGGIQNVGGT